MKNILATSLLLFLAIITNAQSLEGEWKFQKMNCLGTMIYYDDSDKDKENYINSMIKMYGSELDQNDKNDIMKRKDELYAGSKKLYKNNIKFKEINSFTGEGKSYFYEQNENDKIVRAEASIRIEGDKVQFFGSYLHGINKYSFLIKNSSLVLTEFTGKDELSDETRVFYYEKK